MHRKFLVFIVLIIILMSGTFTSLATQDNIIHSTQNNQEFDLLIIAPNDFKEEISKLITHKEDMGIKSIFKTTEDIYRVYAGEDKPEQIKKCIKEAIETNHISFVLLFGGLDQIPMRKTSVSWEYFGSLVVPDVITDLYYADIYDEQGNFSTWDQNQDGVYSEVHMIMNQESPFDESFVIIDEIQGIPDIMIGRIPCDTIQEAASMVNKIILYETITYDTDWFHRIILMGGDTFPSVGGINEGEYVTEYIGSILPSFTQVRLWASQDTFRTSIINRELSDGAGFVSYSGHGLPFSIATSKTDASSQIYYFLPFTLNVQNTNKFPIMYFDACLTGALDHQWHTLHIPCFAWSLLKRPTTGAIACIAATRVGFGGFAGDPFLAGASALHRFFFESYEPGIHLGEMFQKAQLKFINTVSEQVIYDPLTLQEFTLYGDPTLKIGGYPIS